MGAANTEHRSVVKLDPCADVRGERPNSALLLFRAARRAEDPIVGGDLLGVCCRRLILLDERLWRANRLDKKLSAAQLKPLAKRAKAVIGTDRLAHRSTDRAAIEPFDQSHD